MQGAQIQLPWCSEFTVASIKQLINTVRHVLDGTLIEKKTIDNLSMISYHASLCELFDGTLRKSVSIIPMVFTRKYALFNPSIALDWHYFRFFPTSDAGTYYRRETVRHPPHYHYLSSKCRLISAKIRDYPPRRKNRCISHGSH